QGEGIGQRLVIEAESRAFGELGLEGLYCYAQKTAVGFYEKLGWNPEGEEFIEADIPHRTMVIQRPPVDAGEEPIPAW
ncbi:MAG: GNAT family N-acetyltransferase, partial [Phycisphaerales bacterium JB061]